MIVASCAVFFCSVRSCRRDAPSLAPLLVCLLLISTQHLGWCLIGCAIAYFLRQAGVEVIVIEREKIAAESSGAAGGLNTQLGGLGGPPPFTALMLESWSLFATLIPELEEASGVDIGYRQTGCLRAVLDEDEGEQMRQLAPV